MEETIDLKEEFTVVITGDGVDLSRSIDANQLSSIFQVIMGSRVIVDSEQHSPASGREQFNPTKVQESLREYLDRVSATTKVELIVAIAIYMSQQEHKSEFMMDDVRANFASAHEALPKNFTRDFGLARDRGLIASVHGKSDFFYVTNTGMEEIEGSKD